MAVNWNDPRQVEDIKRQMLAKVGTDPTQVARVEAFISSKVQQSTPVPQAPASDVATQMPADVAADPVKRESWFRNMVTGMVNTFKGGFEQVGEVGSKVGLLLNPRRRELLAKLEGGEQLTKEEAASFDRLQKKWKADMISQEELDLYQPETAGRAITQSGQRIAGTASFLVPGGPLKNAAASGFLYGAAQPTDELGDWGQAGERGVVGAVTSVATASILNKLLTGNIYGNKVLPKSEGVTTDLGEDIRKGVVSKPQVKANKYMAEAEKEILNTPKTIKQQVGIELTGGPDAQLKQLPTASRAVTNKTIGILEKADDLPYSKFSNAFDEELKNFSYIEPTAVRNRIVREARQRLVNATTGASKNTIGANTLKNEISSEVTTLLKSGAAPKTVDQKVQIALWKSIKNVFDDVSPEIRALNKSQILLDDYAEALAFTRDQGMSLKLPAGTNIPLPAEKVRSAAYTGANVISKAAAAKDKVLAAVPPVLIESAQKIVPIAGAEITTGAEKVKKETAAPTGTALPTATKFDANTEDLMKAMGEGVAMDSIQLPNGKIVTRKQVWNKLLTTTNKQDRALLQSIIDEIDRQTVQKTIPATQVAEMADMVTSIQQMAELGNYIEANKDIMGPVKGRALSANPYNVEAQSFQGNMMLVAQNVGRALEGGVLRQEDVVKYRKILPQIWDTQQTAMNKIIAVQNQLQVKLKARKAALQAAGYTNQGTVPATESAAPSLQYFGE